MAVAVPQVLDHCATTITLVVVAVRQTGGGSAANWWWRKGVQRASIPFPPGKELSSRGMDSEPVTPCAALLRQHDVALMCWRPLSFPTEAPTGVREGGCSCWRPLTIPCRNAYWHKMGGGLRQINGV